MAAVADDLFSSSAISRWQSALICYEQVVELKAAAKTKKSAKSASKGETLVELDAWYAQTRTIIIIKIIMSRGYTGLILSYNLTVYLYKNCHFQLKMYA